MNIKRSIVMPVLVAAVGLTSGGWLLQQGVDPARNVYVQARLLEEVVRHVQDRFVEETDQGRLYRMAIDGMLQELGDPHSSFMTPEDYEDLRVQTQGEYGGLGIEIDVRDGWLTVISPLPGTPAERAGLLAGDRIIEVDGETTRGWNTDRAVATLRGPRGSTVELMISRVGVEEAIPFEVTREEIRIPAVRSAYMLDDGVGYVELTVFNETATRDLKQAVESLQSEGMRSLVLDMRRNTGGLLDQGMSVADLFLERRQLVLETRGRSSEQNKVFRAAQRDQFPDLPVAVLIGQRSASATEIVAGALQDHDRALLIGETSFGKGSVQTLYELPGRNILKLTTARWYTPSGRSIQKPYGIDDADAVAARRDATREAANAARDAAEKTDDGVPIYRTSAGRTVLGGGGITPDLVIVDTLSAGEQELAQAVRQHVAQFNNLLYRYAVEYARRHQELQPGFPVTDRMLDDFYSLLRSEGVQLERAVFEGARPLIERRLATEISNALWGHEEGWKRITEQDPQVIAARELLREAATPAALFGLLPEYASRRGLTLGADQPGPTAGLQAAHP